MNNTTFSFKRFKHLFVRDIFVNLKPILSIIIGTLIILSLFLYLSLLLTDAHNLPNALDGFSRGGYLIALVISSLFVSGNAFRDFRNKERKMSYLMLPSSTLEKFVSQYLLITLVYGVLFTVLYYLFASFNMLVVELTTQAHFNLRLPFSSMNNLEIFFRFFIPVQALLVAGAATFKKNPLFFTGLSYFIYSQISGIILVGIGFLLISSYSPSSLDGFPLDNPLNIGLSMKQGQSISFSADEIKFVSLKMLYYVYQYGLSILLWIYTWFKIKEKEA